MDYQKRLAEIRERIANACRRVDRDPQEVKIVAVTKYIGPEETEQLIAAGQTELGENRLQVALPKMKTIDPSVLADVRWHFIGSLQTNKVKDVLGRFQLIHSTDRLSLAQEIHKRATSLGIVVPCLIQVNVSGEESKGGFAPAELTEVLKTVREMSGIEIKGYMTMAPLTADPNGARTVFRQLRELRDELLADGTAPQTAVELSMGMSGDFEIAVEEGATFVRIGSILVKP